MYAALIALFERPFLATVFVLAVVLVVGMLVSVPLRGGDVVVKVPAVELQVNGPKRPAT